MKILKKVRHYGRALKFSIRYICRRSHTVLPGPLLTYTKKNAAPIMMYTVTSCSPSSQFDSPSDATRLAIRTAPVTETSSNGVNTMLIGVKNRLRSVSTGTTNSMI